MQQVLKTPPSSTAARLTDPDDYLSFQPLLKLKSYRRCGRVQLTCHQHVLILWRVISV